MTPHSAIAASILCGLKSENAPTTATTHGRASLHASFGLQPLREGSAELKCSALLKAPAFPWAPADEGTPAAWKRRPRRARSLGGHTEQKSRDGRGGTYYASWAFEFSFSFGGGFEKAPIFPATNADATLTSVVAK